MNLKEVMQWLIDNNYVTIHQGKPKFTTLYYKETTGIEKGLTTSGSVKETLPSLPTVKPFEVTAMATYKLGEWSRYYEEFIKACKIPARAQGTHGDTYALNKYSEDGRKAFKEAMMSGYRLDVLIAAVTLYYKSSITLKKSVGNYMSSGEWKTDYETLIEQAKSGTLADHVKTETKTNAGDKYNWG